MLRNPCLSVLDSYLSALQGDYEIQRIDEARCLLETPFFLPDNTRLGVYVKLLDSGRFEVTDYGETVGTLFLSGLTFGVDDSRLKVISDRFGVDTVGGEISQEVEAYELHEAINRVIQAILDTSYLVYTRRIRASPSFISEIDSWLIIQNRSYRRNFIVEGRSNSNVFDYYLARHGRPFLVETISSTDSVYSLRRAKLTSFKVFDSLAAPDGQQFEYACILDDRSEEHRNALTPQVLQTVGTYIPNVILWSNESERESILVT